MQNRMVAGLLGLLVCISAVSAEDMVLVKNGANPVPIIVAGDATDATKQAAGELATYIKKISGTQPQVINDVPKALPKHAIWVGFQPKLKEVFGDVDFTFTKPEEILIVCDGRNLAVLGRDRVNKDTQLEFGTANAVYTFIQDRLGVRWLWPGPLGEDVIKQRTISFAPFTHRFAPKLLSRAVLKSAQRWGTSWEWVRLQRLALDSRRGPTGSHAYMDWLERFGKTHPEYFALQPDGTRSGWPSGPRAKLCVSNPDVWKQWLADAEGRLKADPSVNYIVAGANDSHSSGLCICEKCRAWDHPDASPWPLSWNGTSLEYVALSDRYVTFWNHLGELLRERYPDRDDLYVRCNAYGPTTPAPIGVSLADNTVMAFVGLFPTASNKVREEQKKEWQAWAEKAPNMIFRPNLWYFGGGVWGLPEVPLTRAADDLRFLAENNCIGITVDTAWEHWATQGPIFYLMAQLSWDPFQDSNTVLADYYKRGFGPAAGDIETYWKAMERTTDTLYEHPDYKIGSRGRFIIATLLGKAYSPELIKEAGDALDRAAKAVADGPAVYRERVAFVRKGFDVTRLITQSIPLMERVRRSAGRDAKAVQQVAANWDQVNAILDRAGRVAFRSNSMLSQMRGGYVGGVQDYLGPPSENFLKAAAENPATPEELAEIERRAAEAEAMDAAGMDYKYQTAEEGGWKLVFEDDFDRKEIGDNWKVDDGKWEIVDGCLAGAGRIISSKGYLGFQRMEFEAVTDVQPVAFSKGDKPIGKAVVADMSSFTQARATGGSPTRTGYFFQFGGYLNTQNQLRRIGQVIRMDEHPKVLLTPDKVYKIVVENDNGHVRFIVDGELLYQMYDNDPLGTGGHDHFGFFFHTRSKVMNVKVYIKPVIEDTI